MEIPDENPDEFRGRRSRILQLNRDAARFFFDNLKRPECESARQYIAKRRLTKEMVVRFGLGAVPEAWSTLYDAMRGKGYTPDEMLDAGLIKRGKSGGYYDTFRNRLMFPVIDVRGSVIGFSGRILGDGEPKYLNSPDTIAFKKSKNLFGLNLAKKSKMGMIILVEGNIDVVSLHQAGIDCAAASLGTSLTPDQARLIKRYTDNVVICYDSDGAGVKAAQRAIGILEAAGLKVKVVQIPGAKDPDEFVKERGGDAFRLLLEKSENHIEYQLEAIKKKYTMETDQGRLDFYNEAVEFLSTLSGAAQREVYERKVAELMGVSLEAVQSDVKRSWTKRRKSAQKRFERENTRPIQTAQPTERSMRYDNPISAKAEEGVIRLLMKDQTLAKLTGDLKQEDFTSELLGRFYGEIMRRIRQGSAVNIQMLSGTFTSEEVSLLVKICQEPVTMGSYEQGMVDYINKIKYEKAKHNRDFNALLQMKKLTKGYGDKYGKQ
jgi:DNA primase